MNLKYYLRGLGVGIVVTSLILGIGLGSRKETLSNEEIKERARALGMVEEPVTVAEAATQQEEELPGAEAADDPATEVSTAPEASAELTADAEADTEQAADTEPDRNATPEVSAEPTAGVTSEADDETAPGATPQAGTEPAETKEIVDITINPGEGSYAISSKLEQSGLIDDASEYDAYLCDNGYHTKLRAGVHKIPMGSTREEIAKLLCQ